MPLSMNRDVFITCAVTGAGDTVSASPHVPITPKQIAESAIDAAKAGAALVFGNVEAPLPVNSKGTDMAGSTERVAHVAECLPEICTLDCGTMNFNLGDYVMTNTPSMLRAMARQMTALG